LFCVQLRSIVEVILSLFAAAYLKMSLSGSPSFLALTYVLQAYSTALSFKLAGIGEAVEGIAFRIRLIRVKVRNTGCLELASKGALIRRASHPLAMDSGWDFGD
jgi:hypothetical protein